MIIWPNLHIICFLFINENCKICLKFCGHGIHNTLTESSQMNTKCNSDASYRDIIPVEGLEYTTWLWFCTFLTFEHLDYDTCILTIAKYIVLSWLLKRTTIGFWNGGMRWNSRTSWAIYYIRQREILFSWCWRLS